MKILFAILAHKDREIVDYFSNNLVECCPNSEVVVFDGSPNGALKDIRQERLQASRPLRYAYIAPFHYLTMQEIVERDFDCLVTLDWDMAVLRRGFEEHLAGMLEHFAYLAPHFRAIDPCEGSDQNRQLWYFWDRHWGPLLAARQPYDVFNPGQVFRKDLVERFVADQSMPAILSAVESAHIAAMEEMVYPTRAVAYGMPATSLPGSHALVTHAFDFDELEILAADPNVFLVHKVVTRDQRASVDHLLHNGADAQAAAQRLALRPAIYGRRRDQLRTEVQRIRRIAEVLALGP